MSLVNLIKTVFQQTTYNRVTLGSYALLGKMSYNLLDDSPTLTRVGWTIVGLAGLYITKFGKETVESYRLAKKHIKKEGDMLPFWIEPKLGTYCTRQGVYLAAKQHFQADNYKLAMESNIRKVGKPLLINF